ncbi:MAG TPA: enoyl-CoA hydratase [Acidimicrobiales bacterium]|nr:enoyl-CoA hydratase [Acidimicrobiales bacterium]
MDTLVVERAGGIVTVTFNRPEKKNAVDSQMWNELLATFEEVSINDDDRVLVLTGAGESFCSGADLADPAALTQSGMTRMRHIGDVALRLHRVPKPTIAKVNGVAAGAGCNMALGCDLVVASDQARFSEIFTRRGLSIDFGGSWILPRLIGLHRAKELAFFADVISAHEAADFGIVNRVVPAAELDAFVTGWAERLATGPPLALSMTKTMLNAAMAVSMDQALEDEARSQNVNFASSDFREAVTAFFDKRQPRFTGT